ncbi:MAG: diguanylate cyclase [Vicinamibacterales bacterium]
MPPTTPYVLIAVSNTTRAAIFRDAAAECLRLDVAVVRDGDAAMDTITSRGVPALLIVDLSLPRVDGFTVVRRLRRLASETPTRVIAVSAHEALRAAAGELSTALGISGVLALDADSARLQELIFAGLDPTPDLAEAPSPTPDPAASLIDPEEVVERASVEVRRRFRVPASIGYLRVGEEEGLTVHVALHDGEQLVAVKEAVDMALLRQVAESQEPLVVPSVEGHPLFARMLGTGGSSVRGFAAVPIASSREFVRASLCVLDTQQLTLTAADIDALAASARQAGAELDRATTVLAERTPSVFEMPDDIEALQQLAATDPLTGVANRRGGEKHIANEISRARREKRPLSCILIDIDRFKAVNDTFGHQAGDQLLRDVSGLLRRTVRAYDILVRWGGEEFLLVLPGVDLKLARTLADRLRSAVEALDTHGLGRVTVSAGAAEFENDYDFSSTLRTADRRLYQAKAAGRNCVV